MVAYQSLKDIVYGYISDQITSGKLRPNESINEASICAALEISRTPVREALMQLSSEGYIEHLPRRGFFIRELDLERVRNIYQIIGNLEAMGAVAALERPGSLDLPELRRLAREMDQALSEENHARYHQLQYQFHRLILLASGNDDLIRIVETLKKFFMHKEYHFQVPIEDVGGMLVKMNQEHWQMIQLLEAGDQEAVRVYFRDVHWNPKYARFSTFV